jgi:site-specific DNA recombinase
VRRQHRLLGERAKLLQAHYADAIPLDLLKTEQTRIRDALAQVERQLAATHFEDELVRRHLKEVLTLVTDVQAAYRAAPDALRRHLNRALLTHIHVDDEGGVTSELAEPFNIVLSPEARQLAASSDSVESRDPSEPDWRAWERSFMTEAPTIPSSAPRGPGGPSRAALV